MRFRVRHSGDNVNWAFSDETALEKHGIIKEDGIIKKNYKENGIIKKMEL